MGSGTTRVFVVTETHSSVVAAYYAWCMAQVTPAAAPSRLLKGAGRYPQPVALLARPGVDIHHEPRGLGAALLQDVFARLLELSDDIGCRGLLVHAESPEARDFYLHLVPAPSHAGPMGHHRQEVARRHRSKNFHQPG